jgi:hypothetical protein
MSSSKEPSLAIEYFKEALAYRTSADRLHELLPAQPRIGLPLSDPVYFLYHHAAELALQACLLSHNLPERKGHSIGALFEQCRKSTYRVPSMSIAKCIDLWFSWTVKTMGKVIAMPDHVCCPSTGLGPGRSREAYSGCRASPESLG